MSVLKLSIDNEVTRSIRRHARNHMTTEVCGVLIGNQQNGTIEIRAAIEAANAAQAGTHVTFTQDAWQEIYKVKDETYPDERIMGWYHSHPGFGVFLSEHDMFIHRNFFSAPGQVAWVYDPHTDEEGCFGWVDGEVHRVPTFSMVDNNGDGVERTPKEHAQEMEETAEPEIKKKAPPPAWLRITTTMLAYLSAAVLGFVVAYFLFPRLVFIPVNPITGEPMLVEPGSPASHPGTQR
jgi:proteasome lid subunit RPN8/RPN11